MILIVTTAAAAPEIADALGDVIRVGSRYWVSNAIDVRAAQTAASLFDKRALVINLNSFRVGLVAGILSCILWAVLYNLAYKAVITAEIGQAAAVLSEAQRSDRTASIRN